MTGSPPDQVGRPVRGDHRYQYDVCLSFAGERRFYVDKVAVLLRAQGISVYYDRFETVSSWGENLYLYLDRVLRELSRYCVLFVSAEYAGKLFTRHELASALDRAFRENEAYILPARFDDTPLPGLLSTIGYIDLRNRSPEDFAPMIAEKLGVGPAQPIDVFERPLPEDLLCSPVKPSLLDPRELPVDRGARPGQRRDRSGVPAWDISEVGDGD